MSAVYEDVLLGGGLVAAVPACGTAHLELPAVAESVGAFRRFAQFIAGVWGLAVDVDSLMLVVSELTTNSVKACSALPAAMVVLAMGRQDGGRVRLDVWDPEGAAHLKAALPGPGAPGGRGLYLVGQFSEAWGRVRPVAGTQVWAQLAPAETPVAA